MFAGIVSSQSQPGAVFQYTRYRCVFCNWTDVLQDCKPPKCCNDWEMTPVVQPKISPKIEVK